MHKRGHLILMLFSYFSYTYVLLFIRAIGGLLTGMRRYFVDIFSYAVDVRVWVKPLG